MLMLFCVPRCGRDGSAVVYSLLDDAFRAQFGRDLPVIEKTPAGKPFFPGEPGIHFSLSHCATHVLCALSDSPVGVDIESPRSVSERTIRFFSSPDELSHFNPLELWVLKESYIKLVGGNLMMVRKIRFSLENGEIIAPDGQTKSRLYLVDGCTAAVSTHGADVQSADCKWIVDSG